MEFPRPAGKRARACDENEKTEKTAKRNGETVLNTTNANKEEKAITVADLWRVLLTALPLMIIAAILIVGIGYAYRKLTYRPKYTSEGAFLVMRDRTQTGEATSTGSEVQLALLMMQTCYDVVTSYDVREKTTTRLNDEGGNYTVKQLSKMISVSTNTNSLIMNISATASKPEEARNVLDKFMLSAEEQVRAIMNNDLVSRSNEPLLPTTPSTRFGAMKIVLIGAFGAILVYAAYLVLDILDDRIRTGEDIADIAGLTLLGIIPDAFSSARKYSYKYGKKYAKHYGRYGSNGSSKKEG